MKTLIQILSNTNYPLAEVLKGEFIESTSIKIAVAFLKKSGLEYLYKSIDYAITENNANIEFIVGLDFKTTDAEALSALIDLKNYHKNFEFFCFGDKRDNQNDLIFHPKIYMFHTELSKGTKFSSIVGSSNFTGGGLTSNFEVNTIFREYKPIYYNQLSAIYDEIKYTDSIFQPSKNYVQKYGNIKEQIDKSEKKVIDIEIKTEIQQLREEEQILPGTIPTMKKIIIDIIKKKIAEGLSEVPLDIIYEESERIVNENNYKFKMDTFRNSIRGELNRNENNSSHPQNMFLFIRTSIGNYKLTKKGLNYEGR